MLDDFYVVCIFSIGGHLIGPAAVSKVAAVNCFSPGLFYIMMTLFPGCDTRSNYCKLSDTNYLLPLSDVVPKGFAS